MTQDNSLPPIAEELPEPLLVLHTSYPPDVDLDALEDPIIEQGFECLTAELKALITTNATEPELANWKKFINEAIQLATLRAKGMPQSLLTLLQVLDEWEQWLDESVCLPRLTDAEKQSYDHLISRLTKPALEAALTDQELLTNQIRWLVGLDN